MGVLIAYSSSAHRNLDLLSTREVPTPHGVPCGTSSLPCCLLGNCCPLDVLAQRLCVERSRGAQRPRERPAAHRLVETDQGGVHIRTPAGQRTARIGDALVLDRHDAQQLRLGRSLPAPHTGAFRAYAGLRPARHPSVYLPVRTSPLWGRIRTVAAHQPVVISATDGRDLFLRGLLPRVTGLLGVRPDVDPPAGETGGQAGVLALLADRQRQLVVGHGDPGGPRRHVDDLHLRHPCG